jgi:hypothetical protein
MSSLIILRLLFRHFSTSQQTDKPFVTFKPQLIHLKKNFSKGKISGMLVENVIIIKNVKINLAVRECMRPLATLELEIEGKVAKIVYYNIYLLFCSLFILWVPSNPPSVPQA